MFCCIAGCRDCCCSWSAGWAEAFKDGLSQEAQQVLSPFDVQMSAQLYSRLGCFAVLQAAMTAVALGQLDRLKSLPGGPEGLVNLVKDCPIIAEVGAWPRQSCHAQFNR